MNMALCTACEQLARTLSTNDGTSLRDVHHSNAADLLESATNCRLCEYLISCIGSPILENDARRNYELTIKELLTQSSGCRGRLTYSFFGVPSQCHFDLSLQTDTGIENCHFIVIRWAEDGMFMFAKLKPANDYAR